MQPLSVYFFFTQDNTYRDDSNNLTYEDHRWTTDVISNVLNGLYSHFMITIALISGNCGKIASYIQFNVYADFVFDAKY